MYMYVAKHNKVAGKPSMSQDRIDLHNSGLTGQWAVASRGDEPVKIAKSIWQTTLATCFPFYTGGHVTPITRIVCTAGKCLFAARARHRLFPDVWLAHECLLRRFGGRRIKLDDVGQRFLIVLRDGLESSKLPHCHQLLTKDGSIGIQHAVAEAF
jgi:hypothetical protein